MAGHGASWPEQWWFMGIRFFCPHCDRRLHVKDYLAGRRGICPHCDEPIVIPDAAAAEAAGGSGESEPNEAADLARRNPSERANGKIVGSKSSPERGDLQTSEWQEPTVDSGVAIELQMTADADDPLDEAPHLHWCVRPVAGGQYGAKGAVFKTWLQEGRIAADDHVWQEGWDQWRLAGEVFPSLSASDSVTEASAKKLSPAAAKASSTSTANSTASPPKEPSQGGASRASEQRGDEPITKLDRTRERLLDYRLNRSRSRGREWVAVVVLGLVCVALVSALVWLIMQRQ